MTRLLTIFIFGFIPLANAQFENCPNLEGTYQEFENNLLSIHQYLEGDFLVYEATFSQGGKAYIRAGDQTVMGDSNTKTYCEGSKVTIHYHSAGVIDWSKKNSVYPSDVMNEAKIYKMLGEARTQKQNLRFNHEVYDWTYLKGVDLVMERRSDLWYQNLATSKVYSYTDRTYQLLKAVNRSN